MFPPGIMAFGQAFAHRIIQLVKGFACKTGMRHRLHTGYVPATCDLIGVNYYPSPCLWPDPDVVRPFFWQSTADWEPSCGFGCYDVGSLVDCMPITTQTRGNRTCVNPLSFYPSPPCPWPVAYRVTANARLSVPVSGRQQRRSLKMMWRLARQSGLALARCATTRAFANNLTGRKATIDGHLGATPGGFLLFWGTAHV
jgi:hypothetical protein